MCVFCSIVKGDIPSYKIYEDESVYAFLDIADDVEGHTLVIPKKHYENLIEMPDEELAKVMAAVKKISKSYIETKGYSGVNLINCCGEDAEQSVFHFHMHILPRTKDDNIRVYPKLNKLNSDLSAICNNLKLN